MTSLNDFDDIHTHGRTGSRTLTSIEPGDEIKTAYGEGWYSVGLHPWHLGEHPDYAALDRVAADRRIVAIGETGLDKLRGPSEAVQEASFIHHAELSERLGKPMIVHCVGRYGRLIELRRELRPKQLWIVHGFRGKPELARQLVDAGFGISLGEHFNPGVPAVVPGALLFAETDESKLNIDEIRSSIKAYSK